MWLKQDLNASSCVVISNAESIGTEGNSGWHLQSLARYDLQLMFYRDQLTSAISWVSRDAVYLVNVVQPSVNVDFLQVVDNILLDCGRPVTSGHNGSAGIHRRIYGWTQLDSRISRVRPTWVDWRIFILLQIIHWHMVQHAKEHSLSHLIWTERVRCSAPYDFSHKKQPCSVQFSSVGMR